MRRKKVIEGLWILGTLATIVIMGPIFTIWSMNALFELGIDCTIKTWAAMAWLILLLAGLHVKIGSN